jgi:hypothetical protein
MSTREPLAVLGAILLLAVPAAKVQADMAIIPGEKWQEPHLRFAGVEDFPDYVFYLKYQSGPGNPGVGERNAVRITSGASFTLPETGRRRFTNTALVAVPRGSIPSADTDPDWEWLSEKTPGVLEARLDDNDLFRFNWFFDPNDHYVTPFQVAIKNGQLDVTRLPLEGVAPVIRLGPLCLPMWPTVLVMALTIAGIGVWFARRRRRLRQGIAGGPPGAVTGGDGGSGG